MLGKLMKHDGVALSRVLVPLHLGALGVALVAVVCGFAGSGFGESAHRAYGTAEELLRLSAGFAYATFAFCLVLLCVLTVATFFVVVHRFYCNLFTDEGYLTLTLPVTANQIVLSKALTGALWLLVDFLIVGTCLAAVLFGMDVFSEMLSTGDVFVRRFPEFPSAGEWANFANTFFQVIAWMLAAYASLCLGSSATRHKVATAVGVFLLIGIAVGSITSVFDVLALSALSSFAPGLIDQYGFYTAVTGLIGLVIMFALAVGSYAVCVFWLTRRVNLA